MMELSENKIKRKARIRKILLSKNKSKRNRIIFHISNRHVYAQLLEVSTGNTLVTVSSASKGMKDFPGANKSTSEKLAEVFADQVMQKDAAGMANGYIFDRGGKPFHGVVKVFADKLREKGLKL